MSKALNLRCFVFLLITSIFVSGQHLSGVEDKNLENATVSISTQQYNNATELQPTGGPPQTTAVREKQSAAAPTPRQNTTETAHSQPSEGNGTSENFNNTQGTETYTNKNQPAGNESFGSTESPTQTRFPVTNGSSDPTMPSSAPTSSTAVATSHRTNATNSGPTVVTTPHMGTDGPSRSRTTLNPTTEIRTTQSHTTTNPHSTEKTTTKLCPTAEPKRQGLVGQCLIAIATLAALATIFIVTTIVLATKLAGSQYRHRVGLLHETEMVCISALMNDSDHPIPTPKRPKSNGALIPITEDDDGDDLTLNSFLHDTEGVA